MKVSSVTHAKNGLSALIEAVKQGQSILITEHDHPVAELVPVEGAHVRAGAWVMKLAAEGLVRPPRQKFDPRKFFALEKAKGDASRTASAALLEERAGDR